MIINEPFPWTPQTLSAWSTRSCSWWGRLSWGTLTMILRLLPEDQSAAAPRQDERSNQIFFSSWNCVNMLNLCCWYVESVLLMYWISDMSRDCQELLICQFLSVKTSFDRLTQLCCNKLYSPTSFSGSNCWTRSAECWSEWMWLGIWWERTGCQYQCGGEWLNKLSQLESSCYCAVTEQVSSDWSWSVTTGAWGWRVWNQMFREIVNLISTSWIRI